MDPVLLGIISNKVPTVSDPASGRFLMGGFQNYWSDLGTADERITKINYNNNVIDSDSVLKSIYTVGAVYKSHVIEILPTMLQFQTLLAAGEVSLPLFDEKTSDDLFGWVSKYEKAEHTTFLLQSGTTSVCGRADYYADESIGSGRRYRYEGFLVIEGFSAMGVPDGRYPLSLFFDDATNAFTAKVSLS